MIKLRNVYSRQYWKSLFYGWLYRERYINLQTYCMFIGHPRSGHSYIAAMLDAHPNLAMGIEVDALNLINRRFKKNQLFYCLDNNSWIFTNVLKNKWTGYSYAVPEGSQGRYKKLLVIGDKKGGRSTRRLGEKPHLYEQLVRTIDLPVKILHIIRNPFDNISTICLRQIEGSSKQGGEILNGIIEQYFYRTEINEQLRASKKYDILDVYQESFIASPKTELNRIIRFIGLDDVGNYLNNCCATTYKKPNKSRYNLDWPEESKAKVQNNINRFPFLSHYSFDS